MLYAELVKTNLVDVPQKIQHTSSL